MEQGRWLSILIKETGYVGQEGPEYNYIDDDDDDRADSTEVYDEVYDLDQKPSMSSLNLRTLMSTTVDILCFYWHL